MLRRKLYRKSHRANPGQRRLSSYLENGLICEETCVAGNVIISFLSVYDRNKHRIEIRIEALERCGDLFWDAAGRCLHGRHPLRTFETDMILGSHEQ